MADNVCLAGPAFALTGPSYFISDEINFSLSFDSPQGDQSVRSCEWFLDGLPCIGQTSTSFNQRISCGQHTIGVRVLGDDGWSGIKKALFTTCKAPTGNPFLSGPDTVAEGTSALFFVYQDFSDNEKDDLSASYVFTASDGGTFDGNIFTADKDNDSYTSKQVTVTASRSGFPALQKTVTILNTNALKLVSIDISGPGYIFAGYQVFYSVIATYSDGSTIDVSDDYTFSCPDGDFNGNELVVPFGSFTGQVLNTDVLARKNGIIQRSLQVGVDNTTYKPGMLVVDLFGDSSLEVLGWLATPGLIGGSQPCYAGNNVVPAGVIPSDAIGLASDQIDQDVLKWRFEFNLAQLIASYPDQTSLSFELRARSASAGTITGAYSLKSFNSKLSFVGGKGSYIPIMTDGYDLGSGPTNFSTLVSAGANNKYDPTGLPVILTLTYNIQSNTLQVQTVSNAAQQWSNAAQSQAFQKTSCGSLSGTTVTYTVPANSYYSLISQQDADNKALADIAANGQNYADTNGSCTGIITNLGLIAVDILDYVNLNMVGYVDSLGDGAGKVAYTGANIIPAGNATDAAILASDYIGQSSLKWRIVFNIGQIASQSSSPSFNLIIKGRGTQQMENVPVSITMKTQDSSITMSGSNGNYIPEISGADALAPLQTTCAIAGGRTNSYKPDDLGILLMISYNATTGQITVKTIMEQAD